MKIEASQTYTDQVRNRDTEVVNTNRLAKDKQSVSIGDNNVANNQSYSSGNLITRKEKDFFIQMFPQNAEQIEKHVVFNKNGRITTSTFSKGKIIDGRV